MIYVRTDAFRPLVDVPLAQQPGEILLAMTLFGEARGADVRAKVGVATVVLNRAKAKAGRFYPAILASAPVMDKIAGVCLMPWQFSCFNESDPNRAKLLDGYKGTEAGAWNECVAVAAGALDGLYRDSVDGANHYISYSLLDLARGLWPSWAKVGSETAVLGPFRFYRLP